MENLFFEQEELIVRVIFDRMPFYIGENRLLQFDNGAISTVNDFLIIAFPEFN